ncbi:hypothetical protein Tco_1571599 [Tanacetum coccineum]
MFPEESDKIEKYVGGLPDMIHGSVVASKPKTMQDAVEIATELMDKKIRTFAERQTESKRKFEDTSRNTQNQQQQQQNKRQNTGRAYTAGSGEKKPYGGSKPLCAKCNYHHDGPCAPKCHKCNRVGHLAQRESTPCQHCYQPRRHSNAPAKVYAVGHAGINPDSNVVTASSVSAPEICTTFCIVFGSIAATIPRIYGARPYIYLSIILLSGVTKCGMNLANS